MLEKSLRKLAKVQDKLPILIIAIVFAFTLVMGFYALRLETDSSFDTMFRDDSDTIVLGKLVSNEFGSTDTLYVLVEINADSNDITALKDIRDPEVLRSMDRLSETLRARSTVSEVISLVDILYFNYGKLPSTLEESASMIENLTEDVSGLITNDYTMMNMIVSVNVEQKPGSIEKIEADINENIEEAPKAPGTKLTLTGVPTLVNRIMTLLINDNVKTIAIALLFVFVILWIYFKQLKIAVVAITPVVLTLIWLAGTLTLMDIKITMMIASVGAMMVGIGIDYAIHMTHSYHHNIKKGEKKVLSATVVSVGGALFASAATTVAGFVAMLLGQTPGSITQGRVLAIGVTYAFLATLVVLPALLTIQRRFVYNQIDEIVFRIGSEAKKLSPNKLGVRLLKMLGNFQVDHPYLIVTIVIIFTLIIIPGFGFVYVDTDNENWVPDQDQVAVALDKVSFNFGGLATQNFLIMLDDQYSPEPGEDAVFDIRDPRVLLAINNLDAQLEKLSYVTSVSSPTDLIKEANDGKTPQDLERIKNLIEENPRLQSFFNKDFSITRITINADEFNDVELIETLPEVESIPFPEEVKVFPQGGAAEDIELMTMLSQDTGRTTLLGFLFVIVIATVFYMSFVVGMLAFIPIIFAIVWTIGTMGYINLPFTVLTSGMLAILMGMGIDFSIHIIHKTRELLALKHSIRESIIGALTSTGEAISVATLTTIIGFLALLFASLLGTQRLGMTLAVGIFFTFVSCMVIVPTILVIEYYIKNRKSGGSK